MYHTIISDIVKVILQNGGHFQSITSISETKRRRAFNVDSNIGFVGRRFQKKYCQMYHTILSDIVKPIFKNGGHFQNNTSISEPKRRRASNVDSMYRFCGA